MGLAGFGQAELETLRLARASAQQRLQDDSSERRAAKTRKARQRNSVNL